MSRPKFDPIEYLIQIQVNSPLSSPEGILASLERYRTLSPEQLRLRVMTYENSNPIEDLCFIDLARESDFKYWSVCPDWSADQAVALSFGKLPRGVDWQVIQELAEYSQVATGYLERRDLVRRSIAAGMLPDPIRPAAFIVWARRAGIILPTKLESGVKERAFELAAVNAGISITPVADLALPFNPDPAGCIEQAQETQSEIEDLRTRLKEAESRLATEQRTYTREKGTLLKLFMGLVTTTYGYNPRGDAMKEAFGLSRREALWAIKALRDEPLELWCAAAEREAGLQELDEPDVEISPMTAGGEVVEDYRHVGLSLRRHPVEFLRADLTGRRIVTCAEAMAARDGRWLEAAGLVLVRQRPGSAKGVMFITIEDETGVANLVVWPSLFERQRRIVLSAGMIAVRGKIQREGAVVHLVAHHLTDLSQDLAIVGERDGEFQLPHGSSGDHVRDALSPDERHLPQSVQTRVIYISDPHLDTIKVKTRDFR